MEHGSSPGITLHLSDIPRERHEALRVRAWTNRTGETVVTVGSMFEGRHGQQSGHRIYIGADEIDPLITALSASRDAFARHANRGGK